MITSSDFFKITQTSNHTEFYDYLKMIVLDKKKREDFFKAILNIHWDLSVDFFREYFTTNAAISTKGQHFSPDFMGELLARIVGESSESADLTGAGTGSLIIQKWNQDRLSMPLFQYRPHQFFYTAVEVDSFAIILLIMAFAIRGMNGTIIHGDPLTGKISNIYLIQNSQDDFMAFSEVNILPRTEKITKKFNVKEWLGEEVEHIESPFMEKSEMEYGK